MTSVLSAPPATVARPLERHPASFRDPAATVFLRDGRVLRGLRSDGAQRFDALERSGLLARLVEKGLCVGTRSVGEHVLPGFEKFLEHERIPFVSYPYEWSFSLAQAAALLHLELQLEALASDFVLVDASAYNVQFKGVRPVFIDILSLRPYQPGELWYAHRQFCEQFLNPLLMHSELGVAPNAWFRGALEGIETSALAAMLPWYRRLSPKFLAHVFLPARSQASSIATDEAQQVRKIQAAKLPRSGYEYLLRQLHAWIGSLRPRGSRTVWEDYGDARTYANDELQAKREFISRFVASCRPNTLLDMGCNDGEFLSIGLSAGARHAVGLDVDHGALGKAFRRAADGGLMLLPLYQDLANPSPSQGWRGLERESIAARARPDALFALALEHHLALGRNVPLDEVVAQLVATAPRGVLEFVQKDDPTVRRMLALKGDIFPNYSQAAFEAALRSRARIVDQKTVSTAGRVLYVYERAEL